ncbi:solute carrier organic anion transporter family member 74D-like [Palaemon carinicauda]|uniref:solute carrier organic anion transporter family member 74D-like n=1 Tax=Palaemon carinicauda TaxID=392227 RepID=UPI0035B5E2E0
MKMHKPPTEPYIGEGTSSGIGTSNEESSRMVNTEEIVFTEEEQKSIECGLGFFRPRWLKIFARKEVLVFVFSLANVVQGMYFSYTVAVISTLEKRFKLNSLQIGIVLAGNDISAVLFAPFLGYYLNSRHRPRWLGLGILMTSVSCFMTAFPHFIYGPGEGLNEEFFDSEGVHKNISESHPVTENDDLCELKSKDPCSQPDDDEKVTGPALGALIFIFISQFNTGISMSIFFSIGISYLDDNVSKKTTSVYYSAFLLLKTLGPVLGFLLGGKCLEYWIVPHKTPSISNEDPRWLGAWWVGFVIIGSLLVVIGIGFALLPFQLPATLMREKKKLRDFITKEKLNKTHDVQYLDNLLEESQMQPTKPTLKNMMRLTKKLLCNKIWLANAFNTSIFVMAASGYNIFKPKYLENQFRQTASEANYYVGTVNLIATSLGTVIAAIVLRCARPGPRAVIGYNIFVTILFVLLYLLKMLVKCPLLEASGSPLTGGYDGGLGCSSNCNCIAKFSPVCSEDNTTLFYSPCAAGCTMVDASVNPKVYRGCSCIEIFSTNPTLTAVASIQDHENLQFGTATKGYCPESCTSFVYYVVLEVIGITALATGKIGSVIIYLRSVEDKDKGLSIGIVEVFLALFGFIPGPLIMGKIVDSSCLIWEEKCGIQGNCWLYDTDKFRILLHSFAAGLVFLSLFGDLVMFKYAHLLDLYGDRDPVLPLGPLGGSSVDKTRGSSEEVKTAE